jgi:D-alanyl-D-alanine carboxypeptidase
MIKDMWLRLKGDAEKYGWLIGACALAFGLGVSGYALWQRQADLTKMIAMAPADREVEKISVSSDDVWLSMGISDISEDTADLALKTSDAYTGSLILVNANQPLPEDFEPERLTDVAEAIQTMGLSSYISAAKNNMTVGIDVLQALEPMMNDAQGKDLGRFYIVSAYRDKAYQHGLYTRKVNTLIQGGMTRDQAEVSAKTVVVYPGASEHQTGLTIDICDNATSLTEAYAHTAQGQWLAQNAWAYGFIIRYPEDKFDVTGIIYEPWHIRYVGKPHAEIMTRSNWTLEEYVQTLKSTKGMRVRTWDGRVWQINHYDIGQEIIQVPKNKPWQISGNGLDGVIVTTEWSY